MKGECRLTGPKVPEPHDDFDTVYTRHFAFVWRSMRLLGVPHDALEDACQECFAVVAARLHEFSADALLTTWIFAIVRRVAANQRRAYRRKRAPLQAMDGPLACRKPSPEAQLSTSEAAQLVDQFCRQLPPERREVFVLALVEQVPATEVAQSLNLPLNTVYSRVRLLRAGLRAFLDGQELDNA